MDLDKSITTKTARSGSPADPSVAKPHVLAAQNAGISKKQNSKPMKRSQRLRHAKGIERAADNLDKLELKVQKSLGREKKVKDRRKGWEEVNTDGTAKKKKTANAFDALTHEDEATKEREWVSDEDMPEVERAEDAVSASETSVEVKQPVTVPTAVEDDELL